MPARFRFRPPIVASTPESRWVLARAFGPDDLELPRPDPDATLALAARLGLLPRIASRCEGTRVEVELAPDAARRLRRERGRAIARELRHVETLKSIARLAAEIGIAPVVLKGRALVAGEYSAVGSRPSADIDLLVPRRESGALFRSLLAAGFRADGSRAYEHHLPTLLDPEGSAVELHLHIPGVRIAGRASATWEDLERENLLETNPRGPTGILQPKTPVLLAHTLVHALAQHGLSARGPGWLLIGDLIDLDTDRSALAVAGRWISREVSDTEIAAALELSQRVASGEDPLRSDPSDVDPATLLARHFFSCALDPTYGESLKGRWLEAPVSDRGGIGARLRLLLDAFVPAATATRGSASPPGRGRTIHWLRRPLDLARKALRSWKASRRVGG